MPYYDSVIIRQEHSAELLAPNLAQEEINYIDLFTLFSEQDETLYLLRDSHWNMKGACLAYNAIMDGLALEHADYTDVEPMREKNETAT